MTLLRVRCYLANNLGDLDKKFATEPTVRRSSAFVGVDRAILKLYLTWKVGLNHAGARLSTTLSFSMPA